MQRIWLPGKVHFLLLLFLPGTENKHNYPIKTQPVKAAVFQGESGNKPRND